MTELLVNAALTLFFVWNVKGARRYLAELQPELELKRRALESGRTLSDQNWAELHAKDEAVYAWASAQLEAGRPYWFPWMSEVSRKLV